MTHSGFVVEVAQQLQGGIDLVCSCTYYCQRLPLFLSNAQNLVYGRREIPTFQVNEKIQGILLL